MTNSKELEFANLFQQFLKSYPYTSAGLRHVKTDLVVYESLTNVPRFIIDTKYKNPESVSSDDVAQVIAYAVSKNCKEAILLYPTPLKQPLNKYVGDIRVRSLTFSLNDDFEYAGNTFLHELFSEHIE